jgi:bifunctional non-homologous end joining protein LigD
MAKPKAEAPSAQPDALPQWIKPQLTKLVDEPPAGSDWLHEIKFDVYRMRARLDRGAARLLTRGAGGWGAGAMAAAPAMTRSYGII